MAGTNIKLDCQPASAKIRVRDRCILYEGASCISKFAMQMQSHEVRSFRLWDVRPAVLKEC